MKKILYSTVAALMILPVISMAEESEESKMKTLDEVVVTATRSLKEVKTVPANVMVITAEEIADSGASNIVEVLEDHANILFRSYSGNASQASLDLRGFGGETGHGRTLVLLDGRRLNRPDMSSINWAQLPLDQIERIEVVRGSNSVLYGDTAVAGTIHIITKKGAIEPSITGSLQIGEDDFHSESAGIVGSSEKFSYSLNIANQDTDGWRDRTGFQSSGGGIQLGYDILDNLSVSGGASYNRTDFEMASALTASQLAQDRTQSDYPDHEAENKFLSSNLLAEAALGNFGDLEINFTYGSAENDSTRPSWFSFIDSDLESIGIQPKYVLSTNHGMIKNQMITGVDIYYETLTVDLYSEAARLNRNRTTEVSKDTVGWYLRNEITLNNNIIISAGTRIERSEIKGTLIDDLNSSNNFSKKKDHDGEVFEVGATWLPTENIKLYSRFSTVYRYPFIDEQAIYSGYLPDDFDTDIEAEEGTNIEAGFKINPTQNFFIGLGIYQIDMEDEIVLNTSGWPYYNENSDDTRHRGIEMSLDYNLENFFNIKINYTYQESTYEAGPESGNDVPLVPNNTLSAILDLHLPYNIHLIPSMKYVDNAYLSGDRNNNTEKLNDYTVVDLLLRYKKDIGKSQLLLFLGVNNLFDEEYSTWGDIWGYYYPSPGRKFCGGISGTF